ncbi:MAG: hypothetical protein FWD64_12660 [Acidobacteriaceae bacterium]|nr:hypothetical protein [Acidobacteriaceae bacterium]
MATMNVTHDVNLYSVIHPLDDAPEQKCSTEGLGRIAMTRAVRLSLGALRGYLILMALMLAYHVVDLAGLMHRAH